VVSEWIEGTPLSKIIASGSQAERDHAGAKLALLHYSAPQRAKLLHADPHPGNFRILSDGRLGVVDFGAVARLPHGTPEGLGRMTRTALDGDSAGLLAIMRELGFVRPGVKLTAEDVMKYLGPTLDPVRTPSFTFSREWLRDQAARIGDPRREEAQIGRMLNLPPEYLLIHRVALGSIGVLCQLGATVPYGELAEKWQPGFKPA
jgi:predicted unusual protein kinase regulating ubiquinone biosynthesis (AarF/ABC1/UbiB family)